MKAIAYIKQHSKAALAAAGVILLAAVLLFTSLNANAKETTAYETEAAARGSLTATVGATGTVRANQSAVLAWKAGGTVEQVNYQVGQRVRAGQTLGSLQSASLPQAVILAQADLVEAKQALEDLQKSGTAQAQAAISLRQAQDDYEDAEEYRLDLNERVEYQIVKLVAQRTPFGVRKIPSVKTVKYYPDEDEKAVADEDLALAQAKLEDARRAYDRLKNGPNPDDLAAAQARLDAAQAALDQARVIAPFDGIVTEVEPLAGDVVSAGQAAFRMDDLTHLLVDVEISEVDINHVAAGQPAVVSFDAVQGKTYHGRVTQVGAVGSNTNGAVNFAVTVELDDADEQVHPGMTAAVDIQVVNLEDALLVPNRSVRVVDGRHVVYVLQDGQPVPVAVQLGASSDAYSQVAGGGLQAGDLVIINPPAASFQPAPGNGGGIRLMHP